MINEKEIKEVFVTMCGELDAFKGEIFFNFGEFEHTKENESILSSENYPILKEKMKNLVNLLNNNHSLIEKDIESELWYLI